MNRRKFIQSVVSAVTAAGLPIPASVAAAGSSGGGELPPPGVAVQYVVDALNDEVAILSVGSRWREGEDGEYWLADTFEWTEPRERALEILNGPQNFPHPSGLPTGMGKGEIIDLGPVRVQKGLLIGPVKSG